MGRKDKPISLEQDLRPSKGILLRQARERKGITLTKMATLLGYTKGYLSGVENGSVRVSPGLIRVYEEELGFQAGELSDFSQLPQLAHADPGFQVWNVPHQRNLFFTGRNAVLESIQSRLTSSKVTPHILAVTGLGGVGKTQLAVEYAYRYRSQYQGVLWINADSPETLTTNFVQLAGIVSVQAEDDIDHQVMLNAITRWFHAHPGCLMIIDSIDTLDDPQILQRFLAPLGDCHILLTTRVQAVGTFAQTLELEEMTAEDSALFLLRRTKIIAPDTPFDKIADDLTTLDAQKIAEYMGGLPLALDQAGSYIEETGCGLSRYLDLFSSQQSKLLMERGTLSIDHPDPVAVTWSLSFAKIKQNRPAAIELLYFCAFLQPDAIYEEIITAGASVFISALQGIADDPFELNRIVRELRKYSLVRSNARTSTLTIHRLVQVVIKDSMDQREQWLWAERVVKTVNQVFPLIEVSQWYDTWTKCQRYFSQARHCVQLIDLYHMVASDAAHLQHKLGKFLEERAELKDAEQLYRSVLMLDEELYGVGDAKTAFDVACLAALYEKQEDHEQAENYYMRAMGILEKTLGESHPDYGHVSRQYISFLRKRNRRKEAARLQERVGKLQAQHPQVTVNRIIINDSDDKAISYSNSSGREWEYRKVQKSGDYHSDAHYTRMPGASFEFTFNGIGIDIISDTQSFHGKLDVELDGIVTAVDTSRIVNQFTQTIVFSRTDLTYAQHTIKGVLVGGSFSLDALAIFTYQEVEDEVAASTELTVQGEQRP